MANEINAIYTPNQTDLYACIFRNENGIIQVYNVEFQIWHLWNNSYGLLEDCGIDLVEEAQGFYFTDFPTEVTEEGRYFIVVYQGDKNRDFDDTPIGILYIVWDGTSEVFETETSGGVVLSSTGLDNISTSEPSGRASTFREMVVQLFMRFFNKVDKTSSRIRVYDENGNVVTSQTHSSLSTISTVDKA